VGHQRPFRGLQLSDRPAADWCCTRSSYGESRVRHAAGARCCWWAVPRVSRWSRARCLKNWAGPILADTHPKYAVALGAATLYVPPLRAFWGPFCRGRTYRAGARAALPLVGDFAGDQDGASQCLPAGREVGDAGGLLRRAPTGGAQEHRRSEVGGKPSTSPEWPRPQPNGSLRALASRALLAMRSTSTKYGPGWLGRGTHRSILTVSESVAASRR
jgi:hypothetical protein